VGSLTLVELERGVEVSEEVFFLLDDGKKFGINVLLVSNTLFL
jgi:hypothetical protein